VTELACDFSAYYVQQLGKSNYYLKKKKSAKILGKPNSTFTLKYLFIN